VAATATETMAAAAAVGEAPAVEGGAEGSEAPRELRYPIVQSGHDRPVVDLCFSPVTEDGTFLVSSSLGRVNFLLWDDLDWIGSFDAHNGAVWGACFNNDATRVATASADFQARLYDAVNGDLIHTFEHKHVVKAIAISRDDERMLTGGKDKLLRVFDLKAVDYPLLASMTTPSPIRKANWVYRDDKDSGRILCGCEDGTIQLWDLADTEKPAKEWQVEGPLKDLEVCEAQKTITVGAGKSVYFYDLATFELRKKIDLSISVEGATLNPATGKQFVAGGDTDLWVHVFDYETGKEIHSHTGHHGPIFCLRYSPSGETYASGSEDGTVRLWKLNNDKDDKKAAAGGAAEE